MKIKYDREVDILRITFKDTDIEESGEDKAGVIMDFDIDGNVVGIEILQASKRIDNPFAIAYEIESNAIIS
ncbi:MAG: hypothetical protein DCF19_20495 [Pseudanabaena frigida]|uniref:DUF2283 domain-containing protein n=1 Tax=Pseudanabaena frigida TaxID=945775 RepID=A0A2W4VXN8_9CYAN|nr:MAG: hypothetical protein DCF19_20495 [Pseudanabaena frigida]